MHVLENDIRERNVSLSNGLSWLYVAFAMVKVMSIADKDHCHTFAFLNRVCAANLHCIVMKTSYSPR